MKPVKHIQSLLIVCMARSVQTKIIGRNFFPTVMKGTGKMKNNEHKKPVAQLKGALGWY